MVLSFDGLPTEVQCLILCPKQSKKWPDEEEKWQTATGEWRSIRLDFNSYHLVCKAFRAILQTLVIESPMLESLSKHATDAVVCREVSKLQQSRISPITVKKALVQGARRGMTKGLPSIYQLLPPENATLVSALEWAIVHAAATNQLQALQQLLLMRQPLPDSESLGLDPRMMTDLPTGPLAFAAMFNNLPMVYSLIAAGYTDYTVNLYAYTALEIAADLEFLNIARALLGTPGVSTFKHILHFTDLTPPGYPKQPSGGRDAVFIAIQRGHVEMLGLFLDHGEPELDGDNGGTGALYVALSAGKIEVVSLLIDRGVDLHHMTAANYDEPLVVAAIYQNVPMAQLLLAQGADLNHRTRSGTALTAAASSGNPEMVKLYLEHGAEIDVVVDLLFGSALAVAVRRLSEGADGEFGECIRILINAGADLDATLNDEREGSARAVAQRCQMPHIFDLLGIVSCKE